MFTDSRLSSSSVTEVGAPGAKQNEYYIFTQELNANESKVGEPIAVFTLTNIIVHKGDTVTIHFYNTADEADDKHTFTMQSPYKMDYDLAGGQTKTFSFKAERKDEKLIGKAKLGLCSMWNVLLKKE